MAGGKSKLRIVLFFHLKSCNFVYFFFKKREIVLFFSRKKKKKNENAKKKRNNVANKKLINVRAAKGVFKIDALWATRIIKIPTPSRREPMLINGNVCRCSRRREVNDLLNFCQVYLKHKIYGFKNENYENFF